MTELFLVFYSMYILCIIWSLGLGKLNYSSILKFTAIKVPNILLSVKQKAVK